MKVGVVVQDPVHFDMVRSLKKADYTVTVLLIDYLDLPDDVDCYVLSQTKCSLLEASSSIKKSYFLLRWLLQNHTRFDFILFPEKSGVGYYSLLAKHQGWLCENAVFGVFIENDDVNELLPQSIEDLELNFLRRESQCLADFTFSQIQNVSWSKVLNSIPIKEKMDENNYPLVSICIVHYDRPQLLAQCLHSIREQNYFHYEIILVDDQSRLTETKKYLDDLQQEFDEKGWKLIRSDKKLYPSGARNLAAQYSSGQYLLFKDDDNYGMPDEIISFVRVAQHTNIDILTCENNCFRGYDPPSVSTTACAKFVPLGGALEVGMFYNCFGDTNALVKREVFVALNGFVSSSLKNEDWEFFARAVTAGFSLQTIPRALLWYRQHPGGRSRSEARSIFFKRKPLLMGVSPQFHHVIYVIEQQYRDHHHYLVSTQKQFKALENELSELKWIMGSGRRLFRCLLHKIGQRILMLIGIKK